MPLKIVILGYGVRGRTYAKYALAHPDEYEIAALADPNLHGPGTFPDWREALDVSADAAIIALPDKLHCAAALAALAKGLHVLLEKPLGCSLEECEKIRQAQREAGKLVLTGYVLRFTAYYRRLKEILRSGVIGELVSIHHLIAIGHAKAAHAFCRGNWGREADGTTALVQKCTHDFDLVAWWTNGRIPRRVASFGSLMHWREENAPQGSAARCVDCPAAIRASCPFDAVRLYCEEKDLRYHFADESDAAMEDVVKTSPYGRCVYRCGNDAVDHQTVLMEFADGLTVTLEMEAYTKLRCRCTHFYGTRGVIICDGDDLIQVKPFVGNTKSVCVKPELGDHHGGGDREIMAEFHRLASTASRDRYPAFLEGALISHRIAFMAESARVRGS